MKSFVLQKSANNEVRIGWQDLPCPRKKHGDTSQDIQKQKIAEAVALTETEVISVGDRGYLIDRINGCSILTQDEAERHEERQLAALDIIGDFQQSNKVGKNDYKPGWGDRPKITSFGAYARHTILEAGAIASRGAGCDGRGVEVTLTLPGHSYGAFCAISRWSGYACNRLLQVIRRYEPDCFWFYVWENQKRGALHLHLALSGVCQERLLCLGRKIRKTWYRVLEEIGRRANTDMFVRGRGFGRNTYRQFLKGNRVAEIKKSLAAYFAKYVSKGREKGGEGKKEQKYYPSRWWGISRKLLKEVKNERLKVTFTGLSEEQCIELLDITSRQLERYLPTLRHSYSFEVSYGSEGNKKAVGIGARFIYWFSSEDFSRLEVWLPQLLRYLIKYCSNAVIKGDIEWALHTPVWR